MSYNTSYSKEPRKHFFSKKTKFRLFLLGETLFLAFIAFMAGSFVYSYTHDTFWKLYTYLLHIVILVSIIMLQTYDYLYFVSGLLISFIVLAVLLLYKLNTYEHLGFRSFIKSEFVTYLFIWMLFMASFLTIFASITKYITGRYIRYNVEPPVGIKGPIGNIGKKGDSYQYDSFSTDGEAQYVYNSICDDADKYFKQWKIDKYNKLKKENKSIPASLIFNSKEPQLNNYEFLNILKRICYSKEFKMKINELTNIIIERESGCIEINNEILSIMNVESILKQNNYVYDNRRFLEEKLNRPFRIMDNFYIEIKLYIRKSDFVVLDNTYKQKTYIKTLKLSPGLYMYDVSKCIEGLCKKPSYINIYNLIMESMGGEDFNVILSVNREMTNYTNIRTMALNNMNNYMKIFTMNWIDLILENPKGNKYLGEFLLNNNIIKNTINILDNNSIYMILFIKNKYGMESIYTIGDKTSVLTSLRNEGYIQTGFMLLQDIDLEIKLDKKTERYSFVDNKIYNMDTDTYDKTLYAVSLLNGIFHIDKDNQIQTINIINVNSGETTPWNWGIKSKCNSDTNKFVKE